MYCSLSTRRLTEAFSSCVGPLIFPAAKHFSRPLLICQVSHFSPCQLLQYIYGLPTQKAATYWTPENKTLPCLKTNSKASSYFLYLMQVKPSAWHFPDSWGEANLTQAPPYSGKSDKAHLSFHDDYKQLHLKAHQVARVQPVPNGQEEQGQCLWQQFVAQEFQALEDVARAEKKQSASTLLSALPWLRQRWRAQGTRCLCMPCGGRNSMTREKPTSKQS